MSNAIDEPAPTLDLTASTDDVVPAGAPTLPDVRAEPEDDDHDAGADTMGAWVRFKAPTREQIADAVDEVDTVTLPAVTSDKREDEP